MEIISTHTSLVNCHDVSFSICTHIFAIGFKVWACQYWHWLSLVMQLNLFRVTAHENRWKKYFPQFFIDFDMKNNLNGNSTLSTAYMQQCEKLQFNSVCIIEKLCTIIHRTNWNFPFWCVITKLFSYGIKKNFSMKPLKLIIFH